MTFPLSGIRVVEIASIGPGPFAGMMLADLGAEVIRVERVGSAAPESDPPPDPHLRGRRASIAIDLKQTEGLEVLLHLVDGVDVLLEGFRPGVMERLGAGPDVCMARNPRLVYARVTGWGQDGERSRRVGHDLDYLAVAGALHPMGDPDRPPPVPLNLIGDFGGGGMLVVVGICAALVGRSSTGFGQVVDAAMVDGTALFLAWIHGMRATGGWSDRRGSNLLDGAAPFYRCYETADGRYVAVGAIEPQFYAALLSGLGIDPGSLPGQFDSRGWSHVAARFAEAFRTRTRDEWSEVFFETDACVVPVNDLGESLEDPHMVSRGAFIDVAGIPQPGPAPRFGPVPAPVPDPPRPPGADTNVVLADLGYSPDEVAGLRERAVVA